MELLSTGSNSGIEDNKTQVILSPRSASPLYEVQFNSKASIDEILNDAARAQKKWATETLKSRIKFLHNYRELLLKNREELIELVQLENGKLKHEANAEVDKAIELAEFAMSIPSLLTAKSEYVSKGIEVKEHLDSIGNILIVTPFNFPLMVPHWNMLNALVTGNSVIMKPSTQTPKTILLIKELLIAAGLPDHLFNIVYGEAEEVNYLLEHSAINGVTFVGSTPVAKLIHQRASECGKRVLALGGAKNHTIICDDVNVDSIIPELVESAFGMSGQRCMATSVISVIGESKEVVEKLINDTNKRLEHAALINIAAVTNIQRFLSETKGSIVLNGTNQSKIQTYNITPSIIVFDDPSDFVDEEIFGPVLEVYQFNDLESAIKFQNSSMYGNGATIYTNSGLYAEQAEKLSAGMIGINIGVPVPREPFSFGGLNQSKFGYGDISGLNSLEFFINRKKITTKWNYKNKIDWTS